LDTLNKPEKSLFIQERHAKEKNEKQYREIEVPWYFNHI
jgi:hypothetical protein